MTRSEKKRVKRILHDLIKAVDRELAQMTAEPRATPDPARRPLRPEQRN